MKKRNKILGLMVGAVALVGVSIMGTMAYLTSTDNVENTFTVGNVAITLDEADVKTDGTYESDDRVKANEYHLIPGHTYIKDPTIHVSSDSEKCWLFVKVENGILSIEDSNNTIAAQMTAKGWTEIDTTNHIYAYRDIANAKDNIVVFDGFKISGTADVSSYGTAKIAVTAYAIQADGFDTANAAWTTAGLLKN